MGKCNHRTYILNALILAIPAMVCAQDGFSPLIGGLPFDSGFALGVEYRKQRLMGTPLHVRAKAIGSVKKYEFLETALEAPKLAGGWLFAEIRARYRNYPEQEFFGLGPRSSRERHTNFRLEDFDSASTFGSRPLRWLETGVTVGILNVNTGAGKDGDWPSIEQRFTAAEVSALDRQPHYLYGATFLRLDTRDEPTDPRRGGFHQLRWTHFHDRTCGRFDFHRYQVDLRQFLPSFRTQDTIAVRATTILIQKSTGQQVPFFLQPTVGGGGDLRGYHQYRFRAENVLTLNVEYRWRIRDLLQAVAFADAGRVFNRPGLIGLSGLRGSAGVGGRLKLGDFVFGMDVAWSPEGPRLWFRGSHTF